MISFPMRRITCWSAEGISELQRIFSFFFARRAVHAPTDGDTEGYNGSFTGESQQKAISENLKWPVKTHSHG